MSATVKPLPVVILRTGASPAWGTRAHGHASRLDDLRPVVFLNHHARIRLRHEVDGAIIGEVHLAVRIQKLDD
jgi:hypothetical protein